MTIEYLDFNTRIMTRATPPDVGPPFPPDGVTLTTTYIATDRDGCAPTDRRQGCFPRNLSHTRDTAATEQSVEEESLARAATIGLPEERAGASGAANPMQLGPFVAGSC